MSPLNYTMAYGTTPAFGQPWRSITCVPASALLRSRRGCPRSWSSALTKQSRFEAGWHGW